MKTPFLATLSALAFFCSAHALADTSSKFSNVDALLQQMTQSTVPYQSQVKAENLPVNSSVQTLGPEQDHSLQEVKSLGEPAVTYYPKTGPIAPVDPNKVNGGDLVVLNEQDPSIKNDDQLNIRFTEMPPNARFEFKKDVFIPAYKSGVILEKGTPTLNLEPESDLGDFFSQQTKSESTCALVSDRSYVLMRSGGEGKDATWLIVDKIEIKSFSNSSSGKKRSAAAIHFQTKGAKGADSSVNISLFCAIPNYVEDRVHEYRLRHLDAALGGLFNITLPRFIEL